MKRYTQAILLINFCTDCYFTIAFNKLIFILTINCTKEQKLGKNNYGET